MTVYILLTTQDELYQVYSSRELAEKNKAFMDSKPCGRKFKIVTRELNHDCRFGDETWKGKINEK